MAQWYCHLGGQQYGPIDESVLRQWIAESRVKAADNVWAEGMPSWIPAQAALPDMFAAVPPLTPPPLYTQAPVTRLAPHRGGSILTLGIIGLLLCVICGIIAWVMGNDDMAEMRAGRMDPSGMGMTQAGRIMGIISCILNIIAILAAVMGS